jgi:UPF0755 protein
MQKRKLILLGIVALLIIISLVAYNKYLKPNTSIKEKTYLYIPTGTNFDGLISILEKNNFLQNISAFKNTATSMGLADKVKPGKYEIVPGMSNWKLIRTLRAGAQKPVKLLLKKYRLKQDLAKHIASKLEADSNSIMQLLNNNIVLKNYGLDSLTSLAAFTPNTYEFYWNTDAKSILEKIVKTYNKFWDEGNLNKAKNKNLTAAQVMTLASIIDEETEKDDEKGNVASVYLNRLNKGMKLQADPTVKYAVGDFGIKRVLLKHLTTPSPYNTYVINGLPPGPICTPRKQSIEAVLNAPATNYLFFCASPNKRGYHNFAATDAEHLANAKAYQEWLDKRGLKK